MQLQLYNFYVTLNSQIYLCLPANTYVACIDDYIAICSMYTAYYRFGSNSETPVRCVNVSCNDIDMCNFTSPETGIELPVSTQFNYLHSTESCMVNYVEIIHDCMPRLIDLTLVFISHSGDDKLYLQVSFMYKIRLQLLKYIVSVYIQTSSQLYI